MMSTDPNVNQVESLVPQNFDTSELAPTAGAAEKQFEIQSAIIVARRFPRNEDQAFEKLMRSCQRTAFAEDAAYSFPRGGATVTGPSVNVAREAARVWGNIRYGLEIVRDDEKSRQIRGWAWDLETNTKVSAEDDFGKLIFRKGKNGQQGAWIKPDERDLRELTNRRGAICLRNSLLQLLPKDLIEDALSKCRETLRTQAQKDPDAARKKIIVAFSELNITPVMLEQKLGHSLAEASPAEIAELRSVYKSIADGNSTWAEYVKPKETAEPQAPAAGLADLTEKLNGNPAASTPPPPAAWGAAPVREPEPEKKTDWASVAEQVKRQFPSAVPDKPEPESVIDPTPLTTELMTLEQLGVRLEGAQFVSDVRGLRNVWLRQPRSDDDKEAIGKLCDDRIDGIKSSKTKG